MPRKALRFPKRAMRLAERFNAIRRELVIILERQTRFSGKLNEVSERIVILTERFTEISRKGLTRFTVRFIDIHEINQSDYQKGQM